MGVEVRLFGQPRWSGPQREGPFPSGGRGALLIYLAYHGHWVPRAELAFLLWPERSDGAARTNLRQLLRRTSALEPALESDDERLRWRATTDIQEFRNALGRRDWAAALPAADFCVGFRGPVSAGFDAWLDQEREALARAWREAMARRAQTLERAGDPAESAALWRRLLDLDPLAEDVLQAYLRACARRGERQRGLEAYAAFVHRLHEELGLDPLPETAAIAQNLRAGSVPPPGDSGEPRTERLPMVLLRPPGLVGRAAALAAARATSRPVVLVAGEAGIGKSRLLESLAPHAPLLACREDAAGEPLHPLPPLLLELSERGELAPLGHYREDLNRFLPELGPAPPAPDPQSGRLRLLEALMRALELAAGEGATVVVDDLQWADAATLELLQVVAGRGRLRIYGAYRRHQVGEALAATLRSLTAATLLETIELEALSATELRELLAQLSGRESGPARFAGWLHRASGGNPMFALEALKALFERGDLRSDTRGWHTLLDDITDDYRELRVPRRIGQLVGGRIALLPEGVRRVLESAAVLGDPVDPGRLGEMAGLSAWSVLEALETLEGGGLLRDGAFHHDLTREAVLEAMTPERRQGLHRRAAATTPPERHLERAEHLWSGGDRNTAVAAWQQGAADLAKRGLQAQAIPVLRRALEQAQTEGPGLRLAVELARALTAVGELDEAEALLAQLLTASAEPELRVAALSAWSDLLEARGRRREIPAVLAEALALVPTGAEARFDVANLRVKQAYYRDDLEAAHGLLRARLERGGGASDETRLTLLTDLGVVLDNLERLEEGAAVHLEAARLARRLGARYQLVSIVTSYLHNCNLRGRPEEALALAERALAGADFEVTTLRNNLLAAYLQLGNDADAERHARALIAEAADPNFRGAGHARLARLLHRLGRHREAETEIERAAAELPAMSIDAAIARVAIELLELGGDRHRRAARRAAEGVLAAGRLRESFRRKIEEALGVG